MAIDLELIDELGNLTSVPFSMLLDQLKRREDINIRSTFDAVMERGDSFTTFVLVQAVDVLQAKVRNLEERIVILEAAEP